MESNEEGRLEPTGESSGPEAEEARPRLIAFPTTGRFAVPIEPAPRWRVWINEMEERWANRCLPLLVANQAGWVLLNPVSFQAVWSGEPSTSSTTVELAQDLPHPWPVESHFGYGILTWSVPYLFRTPPGYNLLARGPANWPKDGICALEGLVETDWSVATFTMNWKLTRSNQPVTFEEGEPFCMVVPQRRGELESFRPEICDLSSDLTTHSAAETFSRERDQVQVKKFLAQYSGEFEQYKRSWEAHYFKGLTPDGAKAPSHQVQLSLSEFAEPES
jgi:hypothetical protein